MAAGVVELAHRRSGSGPPAVILHGLLGSGRNWQGIATALGAKFDVVLPDLRNHGGSPWDAEAGYSALVADVLALLDRLGLARVRLVGHSMGGKVAMALALTAPDRVERLVVVDIAPVAYGPGLDELLAAMRALDLGRMTRRAEADAALSAAVPDRSVRAFLVQNLEQRPEGLAWRVNLDVLLPAMPVIRGFPEMPVVRPFAGPTCFIHGERSDYVRPEHEPAIRQLFPAAELHTVAGAGHWVHAERTEAFLAALLPCLEW
jgi:pimeloyl-ACP methyl ester carboxylesterase